MNKNKICNPKTEVASGVSLNDKDYMDNLLSTLKSLVKNHVIALTEASNEVLCQEYKEMFDLFLDLQRETYEAMFRKGWYSIEKAEEKKIKEKYEMLDQEMTELSE